MHEDFNGLKIKWWRYKSFQVHGDNSKQYKTDNRSPVGKAIEVEVEGVVAGEEEVAGGGHHPMKEAHQEAKTSPDEPFLFLATLVALHFTPVSDSVSRSFSPA